MNNPVAPWWHLSIVESRKMFGKRNTIRKQVGGGGGRRTGHNVLEARSQIKQQYEMASLQ